MTSFLTLLLWLAGLQAGPPLAPGRAVIAGTVVPAESAIPLAGASILLIPRDPPTTATTTVQAAREASALRARSDSNGAFSLSVPPGSYTISVEREEFSPQDHYQIGVGGASLTTLTAVGGQRLTGLIVIMNPALAISGTVYDMYGERLAAATIHAWRVKYTPAGRKLVQAASVLSHEAGEYRLFHLMPGSYLVSGSYSQQSIRPWESILQLTPNLANPGDGFATAYYPGALNIRDAKIVSLNTARGADTIDVAFKETQYYTLTVKLTSPAGRTFANTRIALLPVGADLGAAVDYRIRGAGASFSVDRLAQGDYVLVALADFPDPDGGSHTSIISDTRPVRITESSQAEMLLQEPVDLPVRLSVLSTGNNSPLPRGMKVRLERVDSAVSQSIVAEVDAAGGFNLLDVGPGTYDVYVDGMPRTAYLRSTSFQNFERESGRIRIDAGLLRSFDQTSFRWRSIYPLTLTLDLTGGSIDGTVTSFGKEYSGAQVVLVPVDTAARLREDRYFIGYSETLGAFQISGVPPGAYIAYAFQKVETGIYFDPDFNTRISSLGTPVTIETKARTTLKLAIITAEEVSRLMP